MFTDGISLFSGAGGDTIGLTKSGINVIGYSEYIETFIETHNTNHPKCKLIGKDIREIEDKTFEEYKNIYIMFAGFPCFIKGTKVLTDEGYKNIENVRGNELLLTHTGKFQKITNLQRKIYKGKLYHIKAKYHPSPVICTEEHPFYVRTKNRKWNTKLNKYDYNFNKPEWIKANKLTKNDYFGMKINNKNIIPEFNFDNTNVKLDDKNIWFIMGYFVGNGCCVDTVRKKRKNSVMKRICFCINEKP